MRKHMFIRLLYCGIAVLCYQPHSVVAKDTPPGKVTTITNEETAVSLKYATSETPTGCYYVFSHADAAILPAPALVTAKAAVAFSQRTIKVFKPYMYAVRAVYPKRIYHVDPGLRGC